MGAFAADRNGSPSAQSQKPGEASSRCGPSRTAATRTREAGAVVGLDGEPAQGALPERRLEARARRLLEEAADRLLLVHAEHGIVVAAHAGVGEIGGAAGQDAVVGGRHVGVGADDEARPAVEMVAERLLLARRLRVDVDHDGVGDLAQRAGLELPVGGGEGIVEGVHEDAADQVDDQDAAARMGLDQAGAAARRAGRIVGRAEQLGLALDEDERLALVPGVVAEGDRVGAGGEDLVADRLRDAEAAGGVLAVDDDAVEPPALAQGGQALGYGAAAGPADDVAEEEEAHEAAQLGDGRMRFRLRSR